MVTSGKGDKPITWMVITLWLAVLLSALLVVHVSHNCRNLMAQLSDLKRQYNHQQVSWGQLLLEQAAHGSFSIVEQKAMDELSMKVPEPEDIVVVKP